MTLVDKLRKNGRKGGLKVAKLYGQAFREERSRKGGQECLLRYGRKFFQEIVNKRWKTEQEAS